jgi:hypothetical protein
MKWKFWKKEQTLVMAGPRKFYVKNHGHVMELCKLWNEVGEGQRYDRNYMSRFWTRANDICSFPDKMDIMDPDFCGHFIVFEEDRSMWECK